jgi:N-methylhydantoinase B
MDAVDTLYANTRNNPIEDIESHLPLRVNRYELRENMVVPGEWRGGIGSVRVFTYLADGASRSRAMARSTGLGDLTAGPTAIRDS